MFEDRAGKRPGKNSARRILNVDSLKSRTTSVHRLQKGRTSHSVSVRSPCSSPLNLPGISHLSASHLRITNYRRTRRTAPVPLVPRASLFHPRRRHLSIANRTVTETDTDIFLSHDFSCFSYFTPNVRAETCATKEIYDFGWKWIRVYVYNYQANIILKASVISEYFSQYPVSILGGIKCISSRTLLRSQETNLTLRDRNSRYPRPVTKEEEKRK